MEGIVTLPDGRKAKLTGPDKEAIVRKATEIKAQIGGTQQPVNRAGTGEAVGRNALRQFLDNMLAVPNLAATGLANTPTARIGADLLGIETPQVGDRVLGIPNANDVFAGAQRVGETAGLLSTGLQGPSVTPFSEAQRQQQETTEQIQQQRPVASATGGLLGDAATLVTGRGGIRSLTGGRVASLEQAAPQVGQRAQTVLGRAIQSTARGIGGSGKRAGTLGLETGTLAALQGQDPSEVGAIATTAGGTQVAGDVSRNLLKGVRKAGLKGFIGATLLSVAAKEVTPGGFQIIEETIKDRAKEIGIASLLLGGTALATARVPQGFAGPAFKEVVDNTSKAGLLKLIQAFRSDPERVGPVAEKFAEDPDFFGPNARERLEKAFSGETDAGEVINGLMKNSQFRNRFDEIGIPRPQLVRDAIQSDNENAKPTSATRAAEAIGRRLPKGSALRHTFENSGPRMFIRDVFINGETADGILNKLGSNQRRDALEVNLSQMITSSMRDANGGKALDGQALSQRWNRLPESVKNAYPKQTRQNVEAFIAESQTTPFQVLPPLLARSLMMNGELSKRLGAKPNE